MNAVQYDPWDPIHALRRHGRYALTSVEFTVTHLCNMRCEHCAVGDALTMTEGDTLPVDLMLRRLDEVEHLETISLTGGEPTFREATIREVMLPLLQYAKSRGIRTQVNTNLTLDLERYEVLAPLVDVMHISYNYTSPDDFHEMGFARAGHPVAARTAWMLYDRMLDNARQLSQGGLFLSAESMINYRTHERIGDMHRTIADMGCKRHEVHPMYPSAFAAALPKLSLEQVRAAIHRLLDVRDDRLWVLFGTLPFFACSDRPEELELLRRLADTEQVSVRNDPDGRNRLNVDMFNGNVHVTDFADLSALGNIRQDRLEDVFARWLEHPLSHTVSCYCPDAGCCGPNVLVKSMYYEDTDFTVRAAKLKLGAS
ncbi:radical SAM/CxCxxxxC motif protein YfkAB [Xylanibacillus composti]|uniref:Radical SAM core domain-containing protein n=1 Tax=Xylanibacillus composti TaxID=1572762 RepID=A0A8J4H572_9BACL|nr:radical SAM/CxCxxxxC motif protein YfkAB [Xylanibacillus composti]MDT9724767.1 radical SAM/CxCxxxxC motif protein YfkAB [Xylanibacillus composti]GIQ69880.1 putative protein YfkA [Xylanibacillus composti]